MKICNSWFVSFRENYIMYIKFIFKKILYCGVICIKFVKILKNY